jgi:hypothetical protein
VSGDGDTASIGMGQFVHLLRRNLPMIYIIEDNGVYGLTKGQFSATADIGSKLKTGVVNDLPAIDTCALAIQLGATFVGRSFSGDKKQLLAMLKAAIAHKGTVMLDVISPLRHLQRSRGLDQELQVHAGARRADQRDRFCASFDDIEVDYDPGTTCTMCRCTTARTCGCASCTRTTIRRQGKAVRADGGADGVDEIEVLTGVFYIDTQKPTFIDLLNVVDEPLQKRQSFAQLRGGRFGAAGKAFEHGVEGLDRIGEVELAIGDLAEVELRLAGQVVERIIVKHILEFAWRLRRSGRRYSRAHRPETSPASGRRLIGHLRHSCRGFAADVRPLPGAETWSAAGS